MSENVFGRLSPFIQEFIYRNNWTELHAIQVEACRVVFETDSHLLLSSGTASGKTEAAFLPILTKLTEDPPASVGVLYIAPIKALINDQFYRLNDLLKEADIPVWHWHGDVPASHKQKMMKNPSGVLQITPESLESMLINKNRDLVRIFGDLRFVVIDEVHAFMGTDRGIQVLCQLERLKRYIRTAPRRVGLSATLGDYTLAGNWLASGTDREVITPRVTAANQKVRIAVEHFYALPEDGKKKVNLMANKPFSFVPQANSEPMDSDTVAQAIADTPTPALNTGHCALEDPHDFWNYLYEKTKDRKCIIFSNLREHAESSISTLRHIAELKNSPDIYYVHHGSISSSLRETAETTMKEIEGPVVIGATVTLELGIDIGRLQRIIQLEAPSSVSSFLQRLGRSGRRGNPSEIWFLCREQKPSGIPLLPYQIPWRLLQSIAVLQLYLEDRWVEPAVGRKYPFGMLYHQTMSLIRSYGEITYAQLENRLLGMSCFLHVSPEDMQTLVAHLIELEHLQETDEHSLILGMEGDKITGDYRFLAVFPEDDEYMVNTESGQIGKIEVPPPIGERITLAGRNWEVLDLDMKRKTIFVKGVKGKINTFWQGGRIQIHNRVLSKMWQVLSDDKQYPYLKSGAVSRLEQTRNLALQTQMNTKQIFSLGGNTVLLLPWLGTVDYQVLSALIRHFLKERFDLKSLGGQAPYFILARLGRGSIEEFTAAVKEIFQQELDLLSLLTDEELDQLKQSLEYKTPKFDCFIPKALLWRGFIKDYVHMDVLRQAVARML